MAYRELVSAAADLLLESMQCDPRTASEAAIKAGCKRFTDKWTAIGTDAIAESLDRLFTKEPPCAP